MQKGLTSAIINPSSESMMKAYYSYRALAGLDDNCSDYINTFAGEVKKPSVNPASTDMTLSESIKKGLKDMAHSITSRLINDKLPLDIINEELVPALDKVGKGFEKGHCFPSSTFNECRGCKSCF